MAGLYLTKQFKAKMKDVTHLIFPVKLPYYCIKLHGYDGNTIVYDPFMGIGTTAVACIDLGVNYLGTEINKEYIQLAESILNEKKKGNKNES